MKRMVILAVAAALGLSACAAAALPAGSGGNDSGGAKNVGSSASASSSPKATQGKAQKPGSKRAKAPQPKSCDRIRGGSEGKIAQLVDVRVGTHDDYDRVTFEFAAPSGEGAQYFGLPSYDLHRATPPLHEDPSGEPVSLDGSNFAWVVFHGGTGVEFDDSKNGYTITYTGPKDFKRDFRTLAEARQMGDFEATLSWAFGLNSGSCWKVHELKDPVRLAIDFPHD
jgi:opacity protein-like surface antigen